MKKRLQWFYTVVRHAGGFRAAVHLNGHCKAVSVNARQNRNAVFAEGVELLKLVQASQ